MKLLYFSSDTVEVEQVSKEFIDAGIPCEVRNRPVAVNGSPAAPCAELWIRNEKDCNRAFMLCVQLGVGFARRPTNKFGPGA